MEKSFPQPRTSKRWRAKCLTCGIETRRAYPLDLARKLRNVHEWQHPGHAVAIEHVKLQRGKGDNRIRCGLCGFRGRPAEMSNHRCPATPAVLDEYFRRQRENVTP